MIEFGDDLFTLPPARRGETVQAAFTVSSLTASARELLEGRFDNIWVTGEISNLRAPGSGHFYFTLKDGGATLAAVLFRLEATRLLFPLRDGLAVIARGAVTLYEARGQVQLQVSELRLRGLGTLQQRFDELKERLRLEGLFATERKRALPVFPTRVGVITSLQGAVLQDMLRIWARRAPGLQVQVRAVRVQGADSAAEIVAAIAAFNAAAAVDVLIVARGGGSLEDLWSFNEEAVARALAASELPTISAIGHETDFTIADFVADLRAPTPSAAAELLVRAWADWREQVARLAARLQREMVQVLGMRERHLANLANSGALREPRRVVRRLAQRLDERRLQASEAMRQALRSKRHRLALARRGLSSHHPARELQRCRARLEHLGARLRSLGPQATLDRGYALVLNVGGAVVTAAAEATLNEPLQVVLRRGALQVRVERRAAEQALLDALQPPAPKPTSTRRQAATRSRRAAADGE